MRKFKHYFRDAVCGLIVSLVALGMAAGTEAQESAPPDRFGRMFDLPPFAQATDAVRAALLELGKPGGIMDGHDNLAAGPKALIVDPALSAKNRNNPSHTAGTTFMGQFLDHDMTFDEKSPLGRPKAPASSPNSRTPSFDLDAVYGAGPDDSPELYDPDDAIKFKVETGGLFEDLPRDPVTNKAIIADPRNDENLILAGLHAAFLLFHNNMVDRVRSNDPSVSNETAFAEARRLTIYHYHWLILREFLPRIIGQAMVDDILANRRRFFTPSDGEAFIPVEFQIAYRFGHSMIRPSYRANLAGDSGGPFFAMLFDPAGEDSLDPVDLRGGAEAPRRFVGWQTFFDFGDGEVKPNKRIDTTLSTPLFELPLAAISAGTPPTSLPQRNFLRHLTWSVPSGQDVARAMDAPVLSTGDLADVAQIRDSFGTSTPLWFYILREAEVTQDGLQLGAVGGRIIGEVFISVLQADPESFMNAKPQFKPTLSTKTGRAEDFRMIDFLTFAGVDPVSRGQ